LSMFSLSKMFLINIQDKEFKRYTEDNHTIQYFSYNIVHCLIYKTALNQG
jgi:hypothetical protein